MTERRHANGEGTGGELRQEQGKLEPRTIPSCVMFHQFISSLCNTSLRIDSFCVCFLDNGQDYSQYFVKKSWYLSVIPQQLCEEYFHSLAYCSLLVYKNTTDVFPVDRMAYIFPN